MLVAQFWQHAGSERPLSVGDTPIVPDMVGRWLVEHGFAVQLPVIGPAEIKPQRPDETKRGRDRGKQLDTHHRT